jgi:TRAP-type C4-dicarboxylate transport system substrate-binding protein
MASRGPEEADVIDRRSLIGRSLAAPLALLELAPGRARAETQRMRVTLAAGHPPVFLWVKLLDEFFVPEVDRRLQAAGVPLAIEWNRAYGGTLAKLGSELDTMRDGISDAGFVSTVFEAAKMPLQNVSYVCPFGVEDVFLLASIVERLQQGIKGMGEAWGRQGLVYLGGAALDTYHVWARKPIRGLADLEGLKLSAPGPSANWIKETGAVAVAGTLTTYYNDIQTGVSDGALTFATGAAAAKLQEVAPHICKVGFGAMFGGAIAINRRTLERMPEAARAILLEVGRDWTRAYAQAQTALASRRLEEMVKAGATLGELEPGERERWARTIPNVAQGWAKDLDRKGLPGTAVLEAYMAAQREAGVPILRDWSRA